MRFSLATTVLLAAASTVSATELVSSRKLQSHISTQSLKYNLGNLSAIAAANGGNRAFGLPGYKASVDYVLGRIERAGLKGSVQEFTGYFTQTNNMTFTVDGVSYDTATFDGTPSTPNASFVTAPLVLIPDTGSGAGCVAADYAGIVATGKIVLVQRGKCGFGDKAALAKAQGAVSTIIYNNAPGIVQGGSLDEGDFTPVGMILQADGLALAQRLKTGEVVTGNFLVDALGEYRTTWNVIAETKGGNPNKVVVLGAHLDSVQLGAGINDDGSGTSALLEILDGIKRYKTNQKVRFLWFGAEESGTLGSNHYTETLSAAEVAKIALYLNFDMIASPDAYYGVFDGDGSSFGYYPAAGSAAIEKKFVDYLTAAGKVIEPVSFDNDTDYVGFLDIGVPLGGLFTGATPQDSCYHSKCDDIDNINWDVYTLNTKAIAHVVAEFAVSLGGIPARKEVIRPKAALKARGTKRDEVNPQIYVSSCGNVHA